MRKSYTFQPSALRFRRWSRKRYAAFISVQRAVTIGRLTSNIIDRFQKKNLSLHTGIQMLLDGTFGTDEEECAEASGKEECLFLAEWQSVALLPLQISNEAAHPAGYTYIIYIKRGGMYLRVRSTSFYLLGRLHAGTPPRRSDSFIYKLLVSLPLWRGGRGCVNSAQEYIYNTQIYPKIQSYNFLLIHDTPPTPLQRGRDTNSL